MSARPSYWQQLGDWLGAYREPFAIVVLEMRDRLPSGTQLFRINWHRGAVARVRLVAEETDVKPQDVVDVVSP